MALCGGLADGGEAEEADLQRHEYESLSRDGPRSRVGRPHVRVGEDGACCRDGRGAGAASGSGGEEDGGGEDLSYQLARSQVQGHLLRQEEWRAQEAGDATLQVVLPRRRAGSCGAWA